MKNTRRIDAGFWTFRFTILTLSFVFLAAAIPPAALGDEKPSAHADQISPAIVSTLASGDINGAIIAMREEKNSPKLMYLMHAVTRINDTITSTKPKNADAHEIYQNVAISYHNLYLFLKTRGIEQQEYLKEAHNYYRKARAAGTVLHKADCDLLDAALTAASGDIAKAEKKFSKIDEMMMRGDFESTEYLAAYYSAIGNVDLAIKQLESAHRMKPEAIITWLAIGDDFQKIADEPQFQELLVSWKAAEAERKLSLIVPKGAKPKLEVQDETGLFRPQKSMPHYDLKKNKSISKKKTSSKKAKNADKKGRDKKGKSTNKKESAKSKSKVETKKKPTKPIPKTSSRR